MEIRGNDKIDSAVMTLHSKNRNIGECEIRSLVNALFALCVDEVEYEGTSEIENGCVHTWRDCVNGTLLKIAVKYPKPEQG